MEFYVKLIKLKYCPSSERKEFDINCAHVSGNYYIFEGNVEYFVDNGIDVDIIDEGFITAIGDLNSRQLKNYCLEVFNISKRELLDYPEYRCPACAVTWKKLIVQPKQGGIILSVVTIKNVNLNTNSVINIYVTNIIIGYIYCKLRMN